MAGWRLEHTYTELPQLFYSHAAPTPVREPRLAAFNRPLATLLGLEPEALEGSERDTTASPPVRLRAILGALLEFDQTGLRKQHGQRRQQFIPIGSSFEPLPMPTPEFWRIRDGHQFGQGDASFEVQGGSHGGQGSKVAAESSCLH